MKLRIVTAALAAFFMLPLMGTVAYAGGGDYTGPELPANYELAPPIPATEGPVVTELETTPFTPAGTGTVIDNATDADGKEFFTIMTPDENVFFLVIDRQRGQENVYFLNAVTEADLLSLAKLPERPEPAPVEQAPAEPEPEPTPPAPEKSGGMGTLLLVLLIVIVGGGAGYYFKIYRPKQQQADNGDEYEGGEYDPYGEDEYGAEPEAVDPAWYDDDEGDGEV